uniref:Uncharacterized protein n=1 Tax=Caenorhabditis tropicalis TaxID=1561998 RepID=A0A1I7ULP3_9PELO
MSESESLGGSSAGSDEYTMSQIFAVTGRPIPLTTFGAATIPNSWGSGVFSGMRSSLSDRHVAMKIEKYI